MSTSKAVRRGALLLALTRAPCAYSAPDDDAPYSGFAADFPALDLPYNLQSPAWPSMQQALRFSTDAYQMLHWTTGHFLDPYRGGWHGFWSSLGVAGIDMVATYLPPFDSWTHEEFHRAVMGSRGIGSYDEVYDFNIGASEISVSHVKDQELIDLKRDHPTDLVRLAAAGIEGESQLVLNLEKDAFFDGVRNYHQMSYLLIYSNEYAYVASGATKEADSITDDLSAKERTIKGRDFVGHDFTSWVYDLFRPNEPYEARGPHPSGVGLNRYRKYNDLTAEEADYLRFQGRLHLLNFVDPAVVVGAPFFEAPVPGLLWNGSLQHYLTSFGYTVNANLFLKTATQDWFVTLLNYRNRPQSLFGFDAELRRYAVFGFGPLGALSLRAAAWQQPSHQLLDDRTLRPGGLGGATLFFPVSPHTDWYLEGFLKTPGWVAGSPNLDANASTRVGVLARLF